MWSSDHFGWPITARPFAATSTRQFVEVSEVMNQMVRRACLFRPAEVKKPTVRTTASTTTSCVLGMVRSILPRDPHDDGDQGCHGIGSSAVPTGTLKVGYR